MPRVEVGLESRGFSGEHIQLCAEGARRKPNLSGKWTEYAHVVRHVYLCSPVLGLLFCWNKKKEGINNVRKTFRLNWICIRI